MDKDGNEVDTEDSKIKAKIADAQLAIAKERRKLLRETIMMGINRLVIDKGLVRSKVVFDIQSKSNVTKRYKLKIKKQDQRDKYEQIIIDVGGVKTIISDTTTMTIKNFYFSP